MAVLRLILNFVVTGRGERRELQGKQRQFVGLFSLCLVLFHLGMLSRQLWGMDPLIFRWLHLGLVGILGFLMYSPWKQEQKISTESAILAGLLFAVLAYHLANILRLIEQVELGLSPNIIDQAVGWLLFVLVFEGVRRTIGFFLPLLVIGLGVYSWLEASVPLAQLNKQLVFYGTHGIWGMPLGISATIILPIFAFAGIFQRSGTPQFMLQAAGQLLERSTGGAAKMAVVASAGYGMVSGGAASNVAVTGAVTIPAMLRSGFKPKVAGAIESVASTGGAITPPIMGAAVFIMVGLTGISYGSILAKVIPVTIIFYLVLFLQSHWIARKEGIGGIRIVEPLPRGQMIRLGSTFVIPIAVLVALLVLHYSLAVAFLLTILTLAAMLFITKGFRAWKEIIDGLTTGGYDTAWLVFVLACAGVMMDVLAISGIDMALIAWSRSVFGMALFPLLVISGVLCLLLGMIGMLIISYVIAVMLVIPPIVQAGIPLLAAHLFAFYYSNMGYITPPICIACLIASRFAKESFWKIGWEAMRFALPLWILPFYFIYRPELLMLQGSVLDIAASIGIAAVGCILLAAAVRGMLITRLSKVEQLMCLIAGILLVVPANVPDLIGGVMAIMVVVYGVVKYIRERRRITALTQE